MSNNLSNYRGCLAGGDELGVVSQSSIQKVLQTHGCLLSVDGILECLSHLFSLNVIDNIHAAIMNSVNCVNYKLLSIFTNCICIKDT